MTAQEAAQKILSGGLVVFPTETVYGLGALASNDVAVKKIFQVKGRPQQNPLILHIADNSQLEGLVESVPAKAVKLIKLFWPGPLTICFKKSKNVSDFVTAGLKTVCIRRPDHPLAHDFLTMIGAAVAAPSANMSGSPSATRIEDARMQLEDKGIFFLEGGTTSLGIESTVIDVTANPISILRHGAISKQAIEEVLGEFLADATKGDTIRSPGQTLAHYAPKGKLTIVIGDRQKRRSWIKQQKEYLHSTIGFIGSFSGLKAAHLFELTGKEADLKTFASRLYIFLNWCDRLNKVRLFIEFPKISPSSHEALFDRLSKASQRNIVFV